MFPVPKSVPLFLNETEIAFFQSFKSSERSPTERRSVIVFLKLIQGKSLLPSVDAEQSIQLIYTQWKVSHRDQAWVNLYYSIERYLNQEHPTVHNLNRRITQILEILEKEVETS